MDFELGDIILWRTTKFNDIISENTIMLKGLHTGIILKGKKFERLSKYGKSPSNTYTTFLIDQVCPIEEIVSRVWYRPNGCAIYLIKRQNGNKICASKMYSLIIEYLDMDKLDYTNTVYLSVAAYFRLGGILEGPTPDNCRYMLCSTFAGYILHQLGILSEDAVVTNLLPIDFYELNFYQKDEYKRITIFNKRIHTYQWLFMSMTQHLGQLTIDEIESKNVNNILKDYRPREYL